MSMEVQSKLNELRKQISQRLAITELEREIRQMEVDLDYHRKMTRILEETLQEQQHLLARMQKKNHREFAGGCTNE